MRLIPRHQDDVARLQVMRCPGDRYLSFSVKQVDQCIVRDGVLAEVLALIESEESHRALRLLEQCSADDRTVLIVDEFRQRSRLAVNVLRFHGLCPGLYESSRNFAIVSHCMFDVPS